MGAKAGRICGALLAIAVLVAEGRCCAQETADWDQRLEQLQQRVEALEGREAQPEPVPAPVADNGWFRPSWGGTLIPGLRRTTDVPFIEDVGQTPTFPNVRLSGLLQVDSAYFAQDATNISTVGNMQDVFGFRRARLAVFGDVSESVSYIIELDFAGPGRPSFKDNWAELHRISVLGNVRLGYWRMPFGMDELTSVRELTFLDRPLGFAFAPFRQVGAGFQNTNASQTATWELAGFRFPSDFFGDFQGNRGYGMAARITALPLCADDGARLIHLGVGYSFINPGNGTAEFQTPPEYIGPFVGTNGNVVSVPSFVDTGAVTASHYQLFNAELGGEIGSWYMQSELRYAVVDQTGGPIATLPAFYAQSGYFLTGEIRPYNKTAGVFGRVKPIHKFGEDGWGALEIAARYSYIDLNGPGFEGGRLNDLTLGLNWYLNQYTRFQFNFIRALLNNPVHGFSEATIAALRAQVDF